MKIRREAIEYISVQTTGGGWYQLAPSCYDGLLRISAQADDAQGRCPFEGFKARDGGIILIRWSCVESWQPVDAGGNSVPAEDE